MSWSWEQNVLHILRWGKKLPKKPVWKCQDYSFIWENVREMKLTIFLLLTYFHLKAFIWHFQKWKKPIFDTSKLAHVFFSKFYGKVPWCNILDSFPSHLKKSRSILRFGLEKLNCGFFHSFHSRKNTTKQLFQSKFQCRK